MKNSLLQNYKDSWATVFQDNSDGLVRSRKGVFFGNLFATAISNLTDGIFYTTLLLILLDDADATFKTNSMALISGITSFVAIFQLISPFIFERMKHRGKVILTMRAGYDFCQIILLPLSVLLPLTLKTRVVFFIGCIILRSGISNLYSPPICEWHISCISDFCRIDYFSLYQIVSSVFSAVLGLLLGVFMDLFKANDMALTGILVMRGIALCLTFFEIRLYTQVREPEYKNIKPNKTDQPDKTDKPGFIQILTAPFRSPFFLASVLIYVLYVMGNGFTGTLYSAYQIESAKMSYTYLSIVSIAGAPCVILTIPLWNKYIHRNGWLKTLSVSMALYSVCFLMNTVVTEKTQYIAIISNVYCQIVSGGMLLSVSNLAYLYLPETLRSCCIGFYSTMGALGGVASAFLGGAFVNATQGKYLHIFGLELENRAYLNLLNFSFIILDVLVVLTVRFFEKKKGKNDRY